MKALQSRVTRLERTHSDAAPQLILFLNSDAPDSSATGISSNSLTLARLPGESIDSLSSRALALHPGERLVVLTLTYPE